MAGKTPPWNMPPLNLAIRIALSLGLTVSLLDLVRGVARQRVEPMSWLVLVGPVLALAVLVLGIYLLLLLLIELPLRRWSRMGAPARALATAAGLGVPFLCRVLGWEAAIPEGGQPGSWVVPLLLGSAAFFVTGLAVEGSSGGSRAGRHLFGIVTGAPVVLLQALLFFWLRQSFKGTSLLFDAVGGLLLLAIGWVTLSRLSCREPWAGRVLGGTALLLVVATLAAWGVDGRAGGRIPENKHDGPVRRVILITIDTLRHDVLSVHGSGTATPNLDALAAEALRFDNAYSPAPWTLPAFSSMMTGVSAWTHEVRHQGEAMSSALPTLAERLNQAGYLTAAMGYNYFLTPRGSKGTLRRGFDRYEFEPRFHRPDTFAIETLSRLLEDPFGQSNDTDALTRRAQAWVRENTDRDFFFWLHYFDPHGPYDPPQAFYPPGEPDPLVGRSFGGELFELRAGTFRPTPDSIEWIRELYLGEVRYVDDRLGRFVSTLKDLGIYDDALIVVTSDHGEEFYEHEGIDHGHTLYEELLRVPLLIKLPASARTAGVSQTVSTLSLPPTLLDICGVDYRGEEFEGASLMPLWQPGGESLPDHPVLATGLMLYADRRAVIFDGRKYIRFDDGSKEELYDLRTDPRERRDLSELDRQSVEKGRGLLGIAEKRAAQLKRTHGIEGPETLELDDSERELLRSLGYLN